ncbi:MAG: BACON domain-containing protein [Muribaculaceae bacterium]|nr:BACON domain-containing protein [Muribaculaceae bacterium]
MNNLYKYGKMLASAVVVAAMIPVMTSCQKDYQFEIPFAVNQTSLSLGASGGETVVMVYSKDGWHASLDNEEDARWAEIINPSSDFNGDFTFVYKPNPGVRRTATVNIVSGSDTIQVAMVQAGFITAPEMTLQQSTYDVSAQGGTCKVGFQTNLELVTYLLKGKVVYTDSEYDEESGWISNIIIDEEEVTFDVAPNTTGEERRAKMSIVLKQSVGSSFVNEMEIIQKP